MRAVPAKFIANDGKEFDTEIGALAHDALLVALGMEQWQFSFLYKRELKEEYKPTYKECPSCRGGGVVGGGFGDPDGPRDCSECGGRGEVIDKRPEFVEAPPIPDDLQKVMRKTWDEWWENYRRQHGPPNASP